MKSETQYPDLPLATSQRTLQSKGCHESEGQTRLGGVTIYARSDEELRRLCDDVTTAIDRVIQAHASLTRSHLEWQVQKEIKNRIDRRVFGALLGAALRRGIIDQIPCAAESGKVFRVYIHATSRSLFDDRLVAVIARLRKDRVLPVRVVRDVLFPLGGWGTWSSASHILARLALRGSAKYVDAKTFAWPEEVDHAVRQHS